MTLSKPLLVVKGPHSYAGFQHVPPLFCGHLLMDIGILDSEPSLLFRYVHLLKLGCQCLFQGENASPRTH